MDKLPHKPIKCTAFHPLVGNGTQLCLVADFEILNNQNTRNYEQRTELQ
jgi:hypothetical protein